VLGGAAQETDAGSKAFNDGRSNNSLNASGMSPDVIRQNRMLFAIVSRRVNSGVRCFTCMLNTLKKFLLCVLLGAPVLLTQTAVAQVHRQLVCGTVVLGQAPVASTLVSLDIEGIHLISGTTTEPDGTFCVENFFNDLSKTRPARLYVSSFCRPGGLTLVGAPYWPRLRRDARYSGKRVTVGPGGVTDVGRVDAQVVYGHVSLKILDRRGRPLLTEADDWYPLWIRVRDRQGVTVHESGLSIADVERSVDLKESRINLALPEGRWTLEVALAGMLPYTVAASRAATWQRVVEPVKVRSCQSAVEVDLLAARVKALEN
jgi:hypothetical protein